MPEDTNPNDKTYRKASVIALGRMLGDMFQGMLESKMEREEALEVVKAYAMQLAANGEIVAVEEDQDDAEG